MSNKLHPFDRSIINHSYISNSFDDSPAVSPNLDTYIDATPIHDSQLFDIEEEISNPYNYIFNDRLNYELASHSYLWETPNYPEVRMVLKSPENQN